MDINKQVIVIGAGFAGLASACVLAKEGYKVTVLEKNDQPGGRARVWEKDGFKFDMGPSWYWMPDVFENFFALFGKKPSDFYDLKRLDPGYRVYYGKDDVLDVPANMGELEKLFERLNPAAAPACANFLEQAAYKYKVGMGEYVFRPSHSITEFIDFNLIRKSMSMQLLTSMSSHVRKYFKNPKLIKAAGVPGAVFRRYPAGYTRHVQHDEPRRPGLGTWYPMGGMNEIVKAMVNIAESYGVEIKLNTEVTKIDVADGKQKPSKPITAILQADFIIAGADYEHTDQYLLDKPHRNYTEKYWDKRTMSPSSLLFYIGTNKKVEGIQHHNLFFDEDFELHAKEIYKKPQMANKALVLRMLHLKNRPDAAPPKGRTFSS
jgi:phytoene desaturase